MRCTSSWRHLRTVSGLNMKKDLVQAGARAGGEASQPGRQYRQGELLPVRQARRPGTLPLQHLELVAQQHRRAQQHDHTARRRRMWFLNGTPFRLRQQLIN